MKKIYFLFFTFLLSGVSFGQSVFINEIHYDDTSGDSGEGIEIAGPAGTDLSSYTLVPYNGNGGTSYSITNLSGTIPDLGNTGYGVVFFPIAGLQNGAPDGIALANGSSLIQFLSYEGSFTAADGVAIGVTSTDIGVSETGSVEGESLQLIGSGTTYTNFTWSSSMASTYNAFNTGQTFGVASPSVSITSPSDGAVLSSGTTNVDIEYITTNLSGGETVNISVNGTPNINVSSPFSIATSDGEFYNIVVDLVDSGSTVLDSKSLSFSISYPCDLNLGTITTTCDAETSGTDTYTTTIDFTGGGTSTYIITNGAIGSIGGDDPSVSASGQIIITGVDEGTDFSLNVVGDISTSSCNLTRNITSPVCFIATCANAGDIVITEVMQNPSINTDPAGEYFEVYNTTGSAINMQGWVIKDDASTSETHTIASSLIVPANGYVVIGNAATPNGGITMDYTYANDISLGNSGTDGIIIECSSTVIDQVIWDGSFPFGSGVAMELSNTSLDAISNDSAANWGAATNSFGDGDLGTPGSANNFTLSTKYNQIEGFSMYPNPTSLGYVNISSRKNAEMNVTVFDVLGKQVITNTITENKLDVSTLKTGIYIMKVSQEDAISTQKLVIR